MAKPWEEEWCRGFSQTGNPDRDGHLVARVQGGKTVLRCGIEEDAKLAAAAPEMARVLLQERNDVGDPGNRFCRHCAWCEPDLNGVAAEDEQRLLDEGHQPTCPLMVALRKAGVLT